MAEQKQFTLTRQGLQERNEELEYLKTTKRKELADKIKEARGFGDLSENFEYDEAKNEQAKYEARIAELENILNNAVVIDEDDVEKDIVSLGCKVTILDIDFDEELKYTIVGSKESDPDKNKLSDESPIGHALIGHKVNDTVTVEVPAGEVQFKILAIER